MSGTLLNLTAGIDTRRIPYKGSAPAFNDLLGGRVQYCIDAVSIGLQYVKAGRLRALATTVASRLPILPEVPALNETLKGLTVLNWYGMVMPAGVPPALVLRVHGEVAGALGKPDVRDRLAALSFEPVASRPADFAAFRNAEQARWARVIREANIRPK